MVAAPRRVLAVDNGLLFMEWVVPGSGSAAISLKGRETKLIFWDTNGIV